MQSAYEIKICYQQFQPPMHTFLIQYRLLMAGLRDVMMALLPSQTLVLIVVT